MEPSPLSCPLPVIQPEQLKGLEAVVGAFQMLGPVCVALSIRQLKKPHELSTGVPLTVICLHSVEHHQTKQPLALGGFIHKFG